eukprot:SAG11_NODE_1395_length_5038_cov_1.168050_4_plen_115_part_00
MRIARCQGSSGGSRGSGGGLRGCISRKIFCRASDDRVLRVSQDWIPDAKDVLRFRTKEMRDEVLGAEQHGTLVQLAAKVATMGEPSKVYDAPGSAEQINPLALKPAASGEETET